MQLPTVCNPALSSNLTLCYGCNIIFIIYSFNHHLSYFDIITFFTINLIPYTCSIVTNEDHMFKMSLKSHCFCLFDCYVIAQELYMFNYGWPMSLTIIATHI